MAERPSGGGGTGGPAPVSASAPHMTQSHGGSQAPLQPTWRGYVSSTMDALHLFEACLSGRLNHVPRRPHDRERSEIIASGNVFIYEEHASGIKRWTDGVPWSPSRILGNFLIYRELDKPFQPGEKKRAMKKAKENGISKTNNPQRAQSVGHSGMLAGGRPALASATSSSAAYDNPNGSDADRALVGSLVDSYQFKKDGLIKKTISVSSGGVTHHLVSYYNIEDARNNRLMTPSQTELKWYNPREELIRSNNFRAPVDDSDIFLLTGEDGNSYYGNVVSTTSVPMNGSGFGRSQSTPNALHGWSAPPGYITTTSNYQPPPQPTHGFSNTHGLPEATYASTTPGLTWESTLPPTQQQVFPPPNSYTMPPRRSQSIAYDASQTSPSFAPPVRPINTGGFVSGNGEGGHGISTSPYSSTASSHPLLGSQGSSAGSGQQLGYDSTSTPRATPAYTSGFSNFPQ